MSLEEYKTAIETFQKVDPTFIPDSISHSFDGRRIIFNTKNDFYYVYYVNTSKIVKQYRDTWRTGRREVIYRGN